MLINKAIKGEKKEKGLYINRGGDYAQNSQLEFNFKSFLPTNTNPNSVSKRSRYSSYVNFVYGANVLPSTVFGGLHVFP